MWETNCLYLHNKQLSYFSLFFNRIAFFRSLLLINLWILLFWALNTQREWLKTKQKTKSNDTFDTKKTDLFHFNTQKLSFYLNKQLDNWTLTFKRLKKIQIRLKNVCAIRKNATCSVHFFLSRKFQSTQNTLSYSSIVFVSILRLFTINTHSFASFTCTSYESANTSGSTFKHCMCTCDECRIGKITTTTTKAAVRASKQATQVKCICGCMCALYSTMWKQSECNTHRETQLEPIQNEAKTECWGSAYIWAPYT